MAESQGPKWQLWGEPMAWAFLPGALAGVHLAVLLFFLNPHLPFSARTMSRAAVVYALYLGLLSLLAHLPWTWRRPTRARRLLPWTLTAVLALASVLSWTHASHFAFFLPGGINSRLIKAAISLSILSLAVFYTALLHSLSRRPYGKRSRWGIGLLCLASVLPTIERRAAYQEEHQTVRAAVPAAEPSPVQLVVVAIEGATLDAILPLAEQGRVPFLGSLLRTGATGRLTSIGPYRRRPLWASLATGRNPHGHRVVGDTSFSAPLLGPEARLELLPAGIGFSKWGLLAGRSLPVDRASQATLGIWQILERLGSPAGVAGWPGTDPVPSELQMALSEEFFDGHFLPTGAQPVDLAERARLFRVQVEDMDPVVLGKFGEEVPLPVQKSLAADLWRQSLSLFLLEQDRPPAAFFLALPGLAEVSNSYFGGFVATQLEGEEQEDSAAAAELIAAYYSEIDTFLAQLWEKVRQPALLAVVSPAGVEEAGGWAQFSRSLFGSKTVAGSFRGSPDGVLLLQGPGVLPGWRIPDAAIVDVVPTLLYALGYPISRDLDGKVLTSAFDPQWRLQHPLSLLPSYEVLPESRRSP
ncbi:MAG: alkaline phosphatase family protein [Deltaproteobacteria bacterium]|nr:alkaline phosphatase family protein [Deltaproteobacteria bacterium]